MNPNTHEFELETADTPADWKRFEVGEVVNVKGVEFVIEAIGRKQLTLRPRTEVDRLADAFPKAETFTQRLERKMREGGK